MSKKLKFIEQQTLSTFKKEIPSQYFSHLHGKKGFNDHHLKVEKLYRFGLVLPPEFFLGKKIVDLGAGTGENTISLARWGASLTLVEINSNALEIAKSIFSKYSKNYSKHKFINSSLYDLNLKLLAGTFDISHSRGVFTHVENKFKAFKILSSLTKPGGYIIYGDRNTLGGVQEMLQRYAIYYLIKKFNKKIIDTDTEIVNIAEKLFSEDIDRSQASVPRTRKAIIFDRWVIQQQDDPSVDDVLDFFEKEGLEYISSWPSINFIGRGVSTYSDPRNLTALRTGARLVENLWMILNKGELENISSCNFLDNNQVFYKQLNIFSKLLRNIKINNNISINRLLDSLKILNSIVKKNTASKLNKRLNIFFEEVKKFLKILEKEQDLKLIKHTIKDFQILFKGYSGVRHVDYVAYKPK